MRGRLWRLALYLFVLGFILMPFFEQISLNLEWSASMMGASRLQIFRRILLPLALPGLLTASILILVNTVSNFELAFLVSGEARPRGVRP